MKQKVKYISILFLLICLLVLSSCEINVKVDDFDTVKEKISDEYNRIVYNFTEKEETRSDEEIVTKADGELVECEKCIVYEEEGSFRITSQYGNRTHPVTGEENSNHTGADIVRVVDGQNTLATIVAIEDGTIRDVGYNEERGYYVDLQHDSGRRSLYLHLKANSIPESVTIGATIEKGEKIGYMGDTGTSAGGHLHFQVYDTDGKSIIDPTPFLKETSKINNLIIPISSKDADGSFIKKYKKNELVSIFENAGFKNIKTVASSDVGDIKKFLYQEDSVISVTINGNAEFEKDECLDVNAEIVVTYFHKS